MMTSVKKEVHELIDTLPEDVTWEQILDTMFLQMKIRKAESDLDKNLGISHEEVKIKFAKWLS